MGEELFLACCPVPVVAFGEQLEDAQQIAVLRARIERLDDRRLALLADYCLGIDAETTEATDEWRREMREYLFAALDVFTEYRRDTTTLILGEREWIFSGGPWRGDTPTESYNVVEALAAVAITHAPLRSAELSGYVALREEG
jgi:hypothetical protein